MFKKKKQVTPANPPTEQQSSSHDLFRFSVLDEEMRGAARDYSTLQALARLQDARQPVVAELIPDPLPPPEPKEEPEVPELDVLEEDVPESKKPRVSKLVIFGGSFVVIALLAVGGFVYWSISSPADSNNTPITIPIDPEPPEVSNRPDPPQINDPITPPNPDVLPGLDTDTDGLTDAEERIFGTDIRNPDSDEDTYLDNNEVFHGYDPAVPDPALLADSSAAYVYTVAGPPAFSFLTIRNWTIEDGGTEVSTNILDPIRILTTSGSEFRITLFKRPDATETIGDWYDANGGEWLERHGRASDLESLITRQGYPARISQDRRFALIDTGDYLFALEYDLRVERRIEYPMIFEMILRSLRLES